MKTERIEWIVYHFHGTGCFSCGEIQKYAAKCTQTRSTQNVGSTKLRFSTLNRRNVLNCRLTFGRRDLPDPMKSPKSRNLPKLVEIFETIARDNGRRKHSVCTRVCLRLSSSFSAHSFDYSEERGVGEARAAESQNNVNRRRRRCRSPKQARRELEKLELGGGGRIRKIFQNNNGRAGTTESSLGHGGAIVRDHLNLTARTNCHQRPCPAI